MKTCAGAWPTARRALAIGGLATLLGCQKSLPTAPADLMSGVVVYEHANYGGASAHVTANVRDLKDVKGPCVEFRTAGQTVTTVQVWNDCLSSIRLAPGWRATLYRDEDFNGDHLDVSEDIPNLELAPGRCSKGGFNDCTTSIRLFPR